LVLGTHLFVKVYLNQEIAKKPFRFRVKLSLVIYQSNYAKIEAILLSALPKNTTIPSHYPFFMLNVKQGSCESREPAEKIFRGPTGNAQPKNSTLSLPLLYQYHLWKSRGATATPCPPADAHVVNTNF